MLEQDQCLIAVTDLWERIAQNQKTHCQRREEHLAGAREQEFQVSTESFSIRRNASITAITQYGAASSRMNSASSAQVAPVVSRCRPYATVVGATRIRTRPRQDII